jgi:flavodoxin
MLEMRFKSMKALVIYYSYEGNTKTIAEAISKILDCDIIRLIPEKEMTATGFSKYIWGGKQVVMKQKPKLQEFNRDFSNYDTLFVGSPVWSWTYAPAIRTLFENGYIKDKQVYFFCTHEGGIKGVQQRAYKLISKHNTWMGFHDFIDVNKNKELCIQQTIEWLKNISSQIIT